MKRLIKIIASFFIVCLISMTLVSAQEKKNEQKIKIVVADGSGTKVVIDTLIKDGSSTDSIRTKDGSVIYIAHKGNGTDMAHSGSGKHVFVTVSSDGKESEKEVKEITVTSSDSDTDSSADRKENEKIYVYSNSDSGAGNSGEHQKVITWTDANGKESGKKVIVIRDGKVIENEGEGTFNYKIITDDNNKDTESTKYIITKEGMKITIEGDDYEKVKEIVNTIESKLDATAKSQSTDKSETKSTRKK